MVHSIVGMHVHIQLLLHEFCIYIFCRSKPPSSKAEPYPKSSVVDFFGGATATVALPPLKDTTPIDVPPLSQLDDSVLDALPDSLRHEILTEYANKPAKKISLKEQTKVIVVKKERRLAQTLEVIIANESKFLTDARNYIQDWILHYIEGPPEEDVLIFSDYVVKLSIGNLDMTSQILRTMKRFVVRVELLSWYSVFNQLLDAVQQSVKEQYSGQLQIHPIEHVC